MKITQNIRLLERDKKIFEALVKTEMLTLNQINRLFFPSSNFYCYERLGKLVKAGYLVSRPYVHRKTGKKIGVCYYLTRVGFKAIGKEHYNPSFLVEPRKHDYRNAISELYVELTPLGWEFDNSKEVKAKHKFDRKYKISCSLKRKNSTVKGGWEEFGIYIIGNNPQLDTMRKLYAEINRHQGSIDNIVVLHFGKEQEISYLNEDGKRVYWDASSTLKTYRLHVMQYSKGLEMLKIMIDPDYILNAPPFADALKYAGVEYLEPEPFDFADHIVGHKGRTSYLVELATNNLRDVTLMRKYSYQQAKERNRLVIALTPAGEESYWKRKYFKGESFKHFLLLPVDLKYEKNSYISTICL